MSTVFRMAVAAAFCLLSANPAMADGEDIFSDYNAAIQKPAEANTVNVYKAYSDNLANMIEHGFRDGVVINGAGSYAGGKVHADGVGNVQVDRGANVGPIINQTKMKNSTVIIKKDTERSKW